MIPVCHNSPGLASGAVRLARGGSAGLVVGGGTLSRGRPNCRATSSRAAANRPLAVSQRTDSGTNAHTNKPAIVGVMLSIATPRQPNSDNKMAEVNEANKVPAL